MQWQDAKAAKRYQERNRKHAIGLVGNITTAKAASKMRQDAMTAHHLCTAAKRCAGTRCAGTPTMKDHAQVALEQSTARLLQIGARQRAGLLHVAV
ncbi:hypothetical protein L2221_17240, partial [Xanthomonas perforans]|nr:hypothetical protein [Xanthomonas perforans]